MARSRFIPNLLYGTLGLAVTGVAAFYAFRALRNRRAASPSDEEAMLDVRRASRKAGRKVKEAGKAIGRGIEDAGDKVEDFTTEVSDRYATPNVNRI